MINREVFDFVLKIAQKVLEPPEFCKILRAKNIESNTLLHMISRPKTFSAFKILWPVFEENFSVLEQKQILLEPGFDGRNILHKLAYRSNSMEAEFVLPSIKKLYTDDEIEDFLFRRDSDGENFLQTAVKRGDLEFFVLIWKFCEECFSKKTENLKLLFLAKNREGQDTLFSWGENKNKSKMGIVVTIANQLLGDKAFCELLQSRDFHGNHFLKESNREEIRELFALFQIQLSDEALEIQNAGENIKILDELRLELKSKIDVGELNKKLKTVEETHDDCTLHLAIKYGSLDLIDELLESLKKLEKLEIREMIELKGFKNRNTLLISLYNNDKSAASKLWRFMTESMDEQEIEAILHEADDSVRTICFYASQLNNEVVIEILQWMKTKFEPEENFLKHYFKHMRLSSSLGHYFTGYSEKDTCEKFFKFLTESFGPNTIEEIILFKNGVNETPLHYFLHNVEDFDASVVFDFYKTNLERNKFKNLLNEINLSGNFNSRRRISSSVEALGRLSAEYFKENL